MQHCVATYWGECVEEGSRIFSVRALACASRVTAQYQLQRVQADYVYLLVQVRGYRNRPPEPAAMAAAGLLCDALNAPDAVAMRQALGCALQTLQQRRQAVDRQQADGYWGAEPLLDATSLAHLRQLT